jgi:YD repeat-containing protein
VSLIVSSTPGSTKSKLDVVIRLVKRTVRHDAPVNEFQVDLHTGMFFLRQTDLFVPDSTPLSLTRTYRVRDNFLRAFGVGANHPYDICPTIAARSSFAYMDLNLEDDRRIRFPRISSGTGYADAVFRHDETSSEFYGAQIAWNGDGWTLDFTDHRKFFFPEASNAKNYAQGAATEMRDEQGRRILLKRDKVRNLAELVSPAGHSISFKYDGANRIVEARDDAGNIRKYFYGVNEQLETVTDGAHALYRFGYERFSQPSGWEPYLMTSVSNGSGTELLRSWYGDHGRIIKQRLADGRVYQYDYLFDRSYDVVETTVTLPNGTKKRFFFNQGKLVQQK